MAKAGVGVPVKLLHETEGHIITVEMKSGELYRGTLIQAEDNMNVTMSHITHTSRDGRVSGLEQCYLRGSHVRMFVVPDMLKNAPMFNKTSGGAGRGRASVIRAKIGVIGGQQAPAGRR
eukprot:TRINITY_DN202_c0_g1_i1.p1 TRINITY_DN202_c0_g1~~TRINITY_DN202_c0_g1_i1.p1  ORF type:complete len:119 (+),score=34.40 TRINITY_DN202_c0_g1_i1:148-504(+)